MIEQLSDLDLRSIRDGYCPDCGHRGFVIGPQGGLMCNIECGNLDCRARYNVLLSFLYSAQMFGHRIPRQDEGGTDWGLIIR